MPSLGHRVIETRNGKARPAHAHPPILSSVQAPWKDLFMARYAGEPIENEDVVLPRHCLVAQLAMPAGPREVRHGDEPYQVCTMRPGQVAFMPAMCPHSMRTADTGEVLILALSPTFLLSAAPKALTDGLVELVPEPGRDDPFLFGSLLALQAEIQAGYPGGRAYADTVGSAIAAHLALRYTSSRPTPHDPGAGLTPFQLRHVIDFIQAHLGEDLSLEAMATPAGLSPFHFARLFKKSTGMAPHQYLVRQRVLRARELLRMGGTSIASVALEVGFCDQSHLAAHFKRTFGLTPKAFMRRGGSRNSQV